MVCIDELRFRKNSVRQPMQYSWFAATTRNFLGTSADKISKKEIDDLDIGTLCDDIRSEISESQEGTRLTLYFSSMLTFGAVKLFQQQVDSLLDDCEKLILDLIGGDDFATQKKKKKAKGKILVEIQPEEQINLSALSIPKFDLKKVLYKKKIRDDHLILEMDFIDMPEPPQTFGFDPNEKDFNECEMETLLREMMGHDVQPAITEHMPQDNQSFEMNDAPMPQVERQLTPRGSPQKELEGMKTPKNLLSHFKKPGQVFASPSEAAKTAYSPPKKRSRTTNMLHPGDDFDDVMVGSDSIREPALPHDVSLDAARFASPVFDFKRRRRNITPPLRKSLSGVMEKSNAVAALFTEPILDNRVHPESPSTVAPEADAQVGLPDVSVNEPSPGAEQLVSNVPIQSSNLSHDASSPAAAKIDVDGSIHPLPKPMSKASDFSLDAINSFEEHSQKRFIRRGKKMFADRIKRVDVEDRPPGFMTITREEAMFFYSLRYQSVLSLFHQPATMKNKMYLPTNRFWSDALLNVYHQNVQVALTKIEIAQKRKRQRGKNSESRQKNNEQTREEHIENLQVINEQREPSLPKIVDANNEQAIQVPEQRADFIPQDNQMNVETVDPTAIVPAIGLQIEKSKGRINSNVNHDVVHEFEQPPIVEAVFEEPQVPDVIDQIEAAMSPPKRFKARGDRDLQDGETGSNRYLTREELFEIIQSHWNKVKKRDVEQLRCVRVEYEKVIRPSQYSGVEAARYLQHSFVLENMEKLYLEQKVPYDTIYLIKWLSMSY